MEINFRGFRKEVNQATRMFKIIFGTIPETILHNVFLVIIS